MINGHNVLYLQQVDTRSAGHCDMQSKHNNVLR